MLNTFLKSATPVVQEPVAHGTVPFEELDLGIESIHDVVVSAELELQEIDSAENELRSLESSMENIAAYAQSALADGGLRPESNGLVLSIYANLTENYQPLRADNFEEVSQESLHADGAQLQMTEYAIESIGSTTAKIIATAKKIIATAIKATLRFFDQHVALGGRVGKGAAKLTEAAKKLDSSLVLKEKEIAFGSMGYLFADKDVMDDSGYYKQVAKESKNALNVMRIIKKAFADVTPESLKTSLTDIKAANVALNEVIVNSFAATNNLTDGDIKKYGLGKDYDKCVASTVLPGNRIAVLCLKDSEPAVFKMVTQEVTLPEKIKALTVSGILNEAQQVTRIIEDHADLVAAGRLLAESGKDVMSIVSKAYKALKKEEGIPAADLDGFQSNVSQMKAVIALLRKPYVELAKNAALYANARLQYADKSRKNLKKA